MNNDMDPDEIADKFGIPSDKRTYVAWNAMYANRDSWDLCNRMCIDDLSFEELIADEKSASLVAKSISKSLITDPFMYMDATRAVDTLRHKLSLEIPYPPYEPFWGVKATTIRNLGV